MYHTCYSAKKTAEESAKLLNEDWNDTQTVREFIHSRAIVLESQQVDAAKQHILAQLQKGLDVESYDILRREGLNNTAELNSKTTIATWALSATQLLGDVIGAQKKQGTGKPKVKSVYDRLTGTQGKRQHLPRKNQRRIQ